MENQNKLVIGLFGFGVVGEGLYRVLQQTPSLQATIKRICVRDPKKKRNAPAEIFTTNKEVLLNDAEINVIVEVIDETEAAFEIACHTLKSGKSFISASKLHFIAMTAFFVSTVGIFCMLAIFSLGKELPSYEGKTGPGFGNF